MRPSLSVSLGCLLLASGLFLAGCSGSKEAVEEVPEPPRLVGDWAGRLNAVGASLRVVFHVTEAADGSLTATLDSPDQGASGLQVNDVRLDGDQVRMEARAIDGVYTGTLQPGGQTIDGTWVQRGQTFELDLERTGG